MVAAWYIPQPWGHVDFAAVVRPMLRVERPFGAGIDKTYIGCGVQFQRRRQAALVRLGQGLTSSGTLSSARRWAAISMPAAAAASAWSAIMTGNTLATGSTMVKPTRGFAGNIGYQHQWTPNWRSNVGVGIWHLDVPGLNGAVCPAASRATASGGCGLNLIW